MCRLFYCRFILHNLFINKAVLCFAFSYCVITVIYWFVLFVGLFYTRLLWCAGSCKNPFVVNGLLFSVVEKPLIFQCVFNARSFFHKFFCISVFLVDGLL